MRILDRYPAKQLLPVWLWCLTVFIFLSCLIDLFEHLDEITRYRIPAATVWQYYLNFIPLIFVKASPLALLLSAAFVASRLSRNQELLAMNASGTSLLRASVPFVFVGWLAALLVFTVNDLVVPRTTKVYERLRQESFRGDAPETQITNVAVMDPINRLYHAKTVHLKGREIEGLTVLEHDQRNQPIKSLFASRAIWTRHGWLLLHGTIYRIGPRGVIRGDPQPFVERLIAYPVTIESFSQPETKPESMRYSQLRLLLIRLKQTGMSVRRYSVDLLSKLTMPLMNVIVCLIAFAGSTQLQLRGNLKGLGISLGWGIAYYLLVGFFEGVGRRGLLPVLLAVWMPHIIAMWWCVRILKRTP